MKPVRKTMTMMYSIPFVAKMSTYWKLSIARPPLRFFSAQSGGKSRRPLDRPHLPFPERCPEGSGDADDDESEDEDEVYHGVTSLFCWLP
jgi:hypothetical protein